MSNPHLTRYRLWLHDACILGSMALLAACGLIYEYLLAHYAGFVLGSVESTIYGMIGLMIVAMGLGAFSASRVRDSFQTFVWLELAIAVLGASAILILASIQAGIRLLPRILSQTFGLPDELWPDGGLIQQLQHQLRFLPYLAGFVLGWLIGMEIPLLARIRETLHQKHLSNNTGTLYGADYLGAGLGAALWVGLLLNLDISTASAITAIGNLLAGCGFLLIYRARIRRWRLLAGLHALILLLVFQVFQSGTDWMLRLEGLLYRDPIVYSHSSRYQHLVITERELGKQPVLSLYLNGRLQFSSEDEQLYHRLLVHPAMHAAGQTERVLIVGGGDGLALREVWRWPVKQAVLIDLDAELVQLFQQPGPEPFRTALQALNQHSLRDPRLQLRFRDAFTEIEQLQFERQRFDVIIVDLPDPGHPDLDKLYSTGFYRRLHGLLNPTGTLVVQSTSPYHARAAFLSIGKTIAASGFDSAQYHQNIPSFGEWGFTLATPSLPSARERLQKLPASVWTDDWLSAELMQASFVFPADFYRDLADIKINHLGLGVVYAYHHQAWQQQQGGLYRLFF